MARFGIGQPVTRREDRRFLTGHGRFVDDLRFSDQLHLHLLRSPHAHARIAGIEVEGAKAMPGVVDVLTAADLAAEGIGSLPCVAPMASVGERRSYLPPYPVLAAGRVRFVGQPVAAIVAESPAQALDAAEAIEVAYEPLAAVVETAAALAEEAPLVWEEAGDNIQMHWQLGDQAATKRAFAEAAHVSRLGLVNNRLVVATLEPRGAIATYDAGAERFTLHASNQGAHGLRDIMAKDVLGLPVGAVDVVTPDIGGGFGMKGYVYPEQALVLVAARRHGRPVRWTGGRMEAFQSDSQARDHVSEVALALDGDGRFLGLRVETIANLGACLSKVAPFIPTLCYALALPSVYRIPAVHVDVKGVFTHTVPIDAYRGAGRAEANYAIERVIERAARELGLVANELRRRNLISAAELPVTTAVGCTYDSGDFGANMAAAAASADWDGFEERRRQAATRGRLRGIGLANYIEPAGFASGEGIRVKFDPSGAVTLYVGSISAGQGHETAYAQIAAEELGVEYDSIRVVQGDTKAIGELGSGFGGSHFLQTGGPALLGAVERIVAKGKQIAAHLLEAGIEDIEFADGNFTVTGTDREVVLRAVVDAAFDVGGLPAEIEPGLDEAFFYKAGGDTYPSGCHVVEVEIDPETGRVAVVGYHVVDDFGRLLNPLLAQGQVHGGIAQGLGQALTEVCVYDGESGQLLSGSFMDYAMPRADDLPALEVAFNETPATSNPLGVKGCGEAGATGAPAAIVSAILDALRPLGVDDIEMPATPERVWRTIREARA